MKETLYGKGGREKSIWREGETCKWKDGKDKMKMEVIMRVGGCLLVNNLF